MDYEIDYIDELNCFSLEVAGEMIILESDNYNDALREAADIVDRWAE